MTPGKLGASQGQGLHPPSVSRQHSSMSVRQTSQAEWGPQVLGVGVQTVRAERSQKRVTLDGAAEKTLRKTKSLDSRQDLRACLASLSKS